MERERSEERGRRETGKDYKLSGLNWPLKFRPKVMLLKLRSSVQTIYLAHVINKLPTEILIPIGLFCFLIPNFDVVA